MMLGSRVPLGFQGAAPATIAPAADQVIVPDMGPTAKIYRPGIRGVLQRADEAIKQPGMAAALLRSAGATFEGGIGAGIRAGAGYMDGQQVRDDTLAQREADNAMRSRAQDLDELQAKQRNDLGLMGVDLNARELAERRRSNMAREGLDANGQRIQLHGIDTSAATQQRGQDIGAATDYARIGQSDTESRRASEDRRYGDDMQAYIAGMRPAGIGSKAGTVTTKTKTPAKGGGWFGGAATPAQEVTTEMPYSPPTAAPKPGDVVDGMTFLGGDPRNRRSWR